ncbi:hypothetical protein N2152v2_008976 [Parachlorella kessleri]
MQLWRLVSKFVLHPDLPFELHKLLYHTTYADWDAGKQGPAPCWVPDPQAVHFTNVARFMHSFKGDASWQQLRSGCPSRDFDLLQRISFDSPDVFWPHLLKYLRINFHRLPYRALELHPTSADECRWLPGARLNAAECCLVGRDPDRPAIVWAEEGKPEVVHTVTLGQLSRRSAHVAEALRAAGLKPGDAVAIDMPLTVEAVAIYLGIVLAGCVVVSIADSFAAGEIASRLRIANARAIFTQDVIARGGKSLPLYARVVEAQAPMAIVLPASPDNPLQVSLRPDDIPWREFLARVEPPTSLRPHVADAYELTNILFSSGTTGDVVCWPTNMGWMMGPWLVYASLLNSAAIALFQGSPLGREFGVFVERARVSMLGLVPSIYKAWRASGCMSGLDWSSLRCFSSTGEASAPDDTLWLSARAGYKPVIEYCGGTEIGGAFLTGCMVQPQAPSCFSTPVMGSCPCILLPGGHLSPHGDVAAVTGELAIAAPMLGISQRLLNKDHHEVYYADMPQLPGGRWFLRRHGDEMERLPGGYYRAHGRVDDTMNLGGIKVSSVELERACVENVADVVEAAAVACPTPGGGPEQLFLFLVVRPGCQQDPQALRQQCQAAISRKLNPLFKVEKVLLRGSLPRTATNKVMRRLLRDELMPRAKL